MSDLDEIRKIFPNWPSEYDVAKQATNWLVLAQEYYCAALILDSEIDKNHQLLHSQNGLIMTDDIAIRMHGHDPAVFCFAFAIELLIKALYVKDIASHNMQPNKYLNFSNHKMSALVNQLKKSCNLLLTNEENDLISKIEIIVTSGKYPTGRKPSDYKEKERLPRFSKFKLVAEPLYKKLASLI